MTGVLFRIENQGTDNTEDIVERWLAIYKSGRVASEETSQYL